MEETTEAQKSSQAPLPPKAAKPDWVIDVSGLTKSFGNKTVVRGVSIQVARGQIYGFLGPNGSGKTTTIRMLCGLLSPDSGTGRCLGYDILTQSDEIKRRSGYMTQRFSLYGDLSILENLQFVARVYDMPDPDGAAREALHQLGLEDRADQLADTLSGGWKQRLALAACILHKPDLLLLDEPTAGVDPKARRDFWDEIHRLARKGMTVLVSTHYMDEAERCHELAYIFRGEILARGPAEKVVAESGLVTWVVSGPEPGQLAEKLEALPGVDMVTSFGNTLHVSGHDREKLLAAIAPFRDDPAYHWEEGEPTLEDVFIRLMNREGETDS